TVIAPIFTAAWLVWGLLPVGSALGQAASYPWPLQPFDSSQRITGTFSEYRGPANPHFHNAVDIPQADGTPVYAVADGRVTTIAPSGSNAYVRVENFAYVHINPSPSLSVGDSVFARQTILGTILPGQGHVHFIDGYPGSRRNAIRDGGGLTPYEDPWAPELSGVRFYLAQTGQRLASTELTSGIMITVRVQEKNAPPGTSTAGLNNGAYTVGYKILSRDRQTELFVPGQDGVVYRFDSMPSDSYVHNVFHDLQATTSNHVYIPTNEVARTSSWDTSALPDGDYTVLLFAGDTRGNVGELYVDVTVSQRDILAPPQPLFDRVVADAAGVNFAWSGGDAPDLNGFRIYSLVEGGNWTLAHDERSLGPDAVDHVAPTVPATATYYHAAAVDTLSPPNESLQTDVYGVAAGNRRVLIVDGFDRTESSGSWNEPRHTFGFVHGRSLAVAGVGFSTASNEAVAEQRVRLEDYDAVVWMLGDESTRDETFSSVEQSLVRSYLESGGNLFVSGSEIGWDLGNRGSTSDQAFLSDYLKVTYSGDDSNSLTARGTTAGIFSGMTLFSYGSSPYEEDWPDYFSVAGGGEAALTYGNGLLAGVQYEGPFEGSAETGRLVLMGFPFETISSRTVQDEIMQRTMGFFFPEIVGTDGSETFALTLHEAYPTPFSDVTTFSFALPRPGRVRLSVFDVLGREVAAVANDDFGRGEHRLTWSPGELASGVYLCRLDFERSVRTTSIVRVR
ncbi:MAG: T9SS type A sorting domain-containing protein, partial [Rhodothermia bacterium]|nr:T9SS type A sorting domain-containing protein [Rhodothermia bacterium]